MAVLGVSRSGEATGVKSFTTLSGAWRPSRSGFQRLSMHQSVMRTYPLSSLRRAYDERFTLPATAESEMIMSNQTTWKAPDIVDEYARAADLQPPERAVLELLSDRLPDMRMLDLGVGGGRTTLHFAGRVKQYVGMDYSEEMIAACRRRFAIFEAKPVCFIVGDARAMDQFPAGSFDFILFSFNGIDYVSARDRMAIFREIRRVGKKSGVFFFSTHNLQALHTFGDKFKLRASAIINDGVHGGRLRTYYIRPAAQVTELQHYFWDVVVYSLNTGAPLPYTASLDDLAAPWLYYLCTIPK